MVTLFRHMKTFGKLGTVLCLDTLSVKNFLQSHIVKPIEAILCIFWQKIKMAVIFENFLKSCHMYSLDTLGFENFDEIALSLTVKEMEAFLCFCIFGENSKIQNGHHF